MSPKVSHYLVRVVMIARYNKQRHFELGEYCIDAFPLPFYFMDIFCFTLNEISHIYHELRLKQVKFEYRILKNPGTFTTSIIGNNGKLKSIGTVFDIKACPGFGITFHMGMNSVFLG